MLHEALALAGIGGAVVGVMMFVLWVIHLRIRNAGIVDVGWAFGIGIIAVIYALLGPGDEKRRILCAVMASFWSLRLGGYLYRRNIGHPEEGRYRQLRAEWGGNVSLKFLVFFEFQALLDLVLSLPFLLACLNQESTVSVVEILGIVLWGIAMLGESVADAQLAGFKRSALPGQVCQEGLWNYSRHPNYFFEWLIWVAWALFALGSPYGWLALVCPALMLFFLLRITGIPATEAQALRSKGESYANYQKTTSVFVPWWKKRLNV